MDHNLSLITTIAAAFALALIFGLIAEKLKLPALIGYLFAGILIGPSTPGFVADIAIASQLSEIGVMLLMFGVGLHFSVQDLMSVKRIALPGALAQMTLATLLGMLVAHYWGWSMGHGLVFGLSLSCASTVVLLKALESRRILESMNGKIAVGWLVVEDMVTVLVLVLMPALAGVLGGQGEVGNTGAIWEAIGVTLLEITGFVVVMLVVGKRVLPWLLWYVAGTGSRELFTLTVIAVAIGVAFFASSLFHVSFALGAFFAGMIMRESEYSHRAAEDSLPFRDAFAVLFFVAVGMLFDPAILVKQPVQVLSVVAIIILGKSLAAIAIVLALRYPLNTALTVAASLAQIGEFSFILAGLGVSLNLLSQDGMSLVLAGALISIALNPLVFATIKPLSNWVINKSDVARRLSERMDPYSELPMSTERKFLEGQVVLVGYGRVGRRIAQALTASMIPFVVAEQNREVVEKLRKQGQPAVSGNAADPMVLIQAHIANAAMLIIATPDSMDIRKMVDIAKQLKPEIEVVIRTHHEDEYQRLQKEFGEAVFFGEEELAKGMSGHVLQRFEKQII
ncbi:YbaL family putative K(+) efflux transporter [Methylophilus medardicus]|uniref:Kef family K(+) transporter n=1 Tax=Methylophilus medardicus TaxID=2588534 RepID=A0A5B8CUK1_9PROT|nr:YbaL family putative K(+) efflux transporter [Methylophilus medardicus]QDC44565.1 Kef family K(+) transporter [Methylophilus medardicus]QDC49572.1 Kef family K(+) transporter [Methylophilus medardicus]QDC53277.1 Kef family K(+) transporter [Methylophilus medardicus]